ncbi:MAG: divalent-cation tolerance protein CutA [Planctomycetes bacterium]|nr:divalent-cation tolerance protein CutA [Planctomycetota bacterium]
MTDFVQIATTSATEQQAEQIAQALVDERLAACVQILGPIRSIYRWQEKVEQAAEWLCVAKTRRSLFGDVEAKIRDLHSYECPEIVATPIVDGSKAYLDWLDNQLTD